MSRRAVLAGGAAAALSSGGAGLAWWWNGRERLIEPSSSEVAHGEAARPHSGRTVRSALSAREGMAALGFQSAATWLYGGQLPGPAIRARTGDVLDVEVHNLLPQSTSVHWHGIALRNDMDGVPGLTGPAIKPGGRFTYRFTLPDPGTYFFHPHLGVQLDRGLYGPLIVEDPEERLAPDVEHVVMLDDWTDGLGSGTGPDSQLAALSSANGMSMMDMSNPGHAGVSATAPLGTDGGDVHYRLHLINGRGPDDPATLAAKPGDTVRLRLINAAADTAYRVYLQGHRLRVTHADGFAVVPVMVDELIIGMGERYDVQVVAAAGAFTLVGTPEAKGGRSARAVLRTRPGGGSDDALPPRVQGARTLTYDDLVPLGDQLPTRKVDRRLSLRLSLVGNAYKWALNDKVMEDMQHLSDSLRVHAGERVELTYRNDSGMFHPMHLHGHTFELARDGAPGPRKDTVIVAPGATVATFFDADNPGQWMLHCHNVYHQAAGMETVLSYRT